MAQPNIILITPHDLGQHLGCYGVGSVRTPHIDRLAEQGVRFARSFCVAPQCSPSRAAMLTGRYPHANGVLGLCHGGFKWDLHDNEVHLAQRLHDAGWYSALVGIQHETRRPDQMGYDEIVPEQFRPDGHALAASIADQAVEFIGRRADADRPFFLQLGFFEPHRAPGTPTNWPPSAHPPVDKPTVPGYLVDDAAAREELGCFEASVQDVDDAVGRVMQALDAHGLGDDTLVIFTADHGIPFPRAKCSVYDPGLEVPLILRWPNGPWSAGTVHEAMVSKVDYVPTLCDLLGFETPGDLHGRSFAPLLRGEPFEPRSAVFGEMTFHDYYDPIRCLRTERHKLIVNFMFNKGFMDPSQQWRPRTITVKPADPARSRHPLVELYDLDADLLEHNNLAEDPAHAATRRDLLDRLHRWMQETGDPLLEGVPTPPMHEEALAVLGGDAT